MIDLPKLTPADKDKMPESIDAQNIQVTHTPWFVEGSKDTVLSGATPSPKAGGIAAKHIAVEDDWFKTRPCPHITKIKMKVENNRIVIDGAIEFVLIDHSQKNLKLSEVKRTSSSAKQTLMPLTKNQVSYVVMDNQGIATITPTMPFDALNVKHDINTQTFLLAVVYTDNAGNILNLQQIANPEHPTGKHFPGKLNWMLTQTGVWQRNIIPEIHGKPGQHGTGYMSAANIHGAFIGGVTRNPRADDLGGKGFSHIAIPVAVGVKSYVSVVENNDHKVVASEKLLPYTGYVRKTVDSRGGSHSIPNDKMAFHPIFVKPRTYEVDYQNPAELEFIIVLTHSEPLPLTTNIEPWMLEKSLGDTPLQPSIRDFAALCGFLHVTPVVDYITEFNIIIAHQGLSKVNVHLTPLPVIKPENEDLFAVVEDSKVSLSGLKLNDDGLLPYISSLNTIRHAYIQKKPLKRAVLSYRHKTQTWSVEALNYTLPQTAAAELIGQGEMTGIINAGVISDHQIYTGAPGDQVFHGWFNEAVAVCGGIGVKFKKNYDFLAKIFQVASKSDIKFVRQNMHIRYLPLNSTKYITHDSNSMNNLCIFPFLPASMSIKNGHIQSDYGTNFKGDNILNSSHQDIAGSILVPNWIDRALSQTNVNPEIVDYGNTKDSNGFFYRSNGGFAQGTAKALRAFYDKKAFTLFQSVEHEYMFTVPRTEGDNYPSAITLPNIDDDTTFYSRFDVNPYAPNRSYNYMHRLRANAMPPLTRILMGFLIDSAGSNTVPLLPGYSYTDRNHAVITADNISHELQVSGNVFNFGRSPQAPNTTPAKMQDLEIDITIEALL